jgi:hypothetical protein
MKKICITTALLLIFTAMGFAQRDAFGIYWEVNFPNNGNYLTKTSWAGGKMEYRHFLKKDLSVGLAMNWSSYSQYFTRQTYEKADGNAAVTSDFVAHVYTLPITATIHHYFARKGNILPYVGGGIGAQYMDQRLFYNVYETSDYNWGFVVRPEAGIYVSPPGFDAGFLLALNYSFATNENGITKKNKFQNFGITIGVAFLQ